LLVFLSTRSSVLGYEINNLEQDIRSAEMKQHDIESQIATKCSAPTIETIASSQLNMHMPEDKDLMLVYENGRLVSGSYNYSNYK
jgi:cell division protein FtsL